MNDSRDFPDAETVRSGQSHVTSQSVFLPPQQDLGGMLSRSLGMPSRKMGLQAFGTHMVYRETNLKNQRLLQHLFRKRSNPWVSYVSEHTSPHVMSESQTPVQDQRCQSGPTARNPVILSEGTFF